MSKEEKIFTNKKRRERNISLSKKLDITLDQKEIFIQKDNINYRIVLASILENGKNKIFLMCNQVKSPKKYEIELGLEILREKCKTFRICNNLEEAFKMLKNIFSKKKFKIKEENEDLIIINFTIHNCIEYKEESVNFDLERKDNYKNNYKDNYKKTYKDNYKDTYIDIYKDTFKDNYKDNYKDIFKDNFKNNNYNDEYSKISNNLSITKNINNSVSKNNKKKKKEKDKEKKKNNYSELQQKINLLFEYDENKELRIRDLIISEGELLYDCYRLKRELKDLKKYIQYNEDNIKNIKLYENKTNEDEEKENKGYESGDEKVTINIKKLKYY